MFSGTGDDSCTNGLFSGCHSNTDQELTSSNDDKCQIINEIYLEKDSA